MSQWPYGLNLGRINPILHEQAIEAFREGDAIGFLISLENTGGLHLVFDNLRPLKERGIFEEALSDAFTASRTNNQHVQSSLIDVLFLCADRGKLRASADELPGLGPFTVYRGVAGVGRRRRVKGLSWTDRLDLACWFAMRFPHLKKPAVFTTELTVEDVYFYCDGRNESEFVARPRRVRRLKMTADEMRERARQAKTGNKGSDNSQQSPEIRHKTLDT